MQKKKSLSAVKIGMNRDSHSSQLQNVEYSLAVNVTTSNEGGESLNVQLEPSNFFGVEFADGYKVIGFRTDLLKQKTYYFLVNTEETDNLNTNYKRSSIGYVDFSNVLSSDYNNQQDIENCGDCNNSVNNLVTPLEDTIQTPTLTYVELLHDRCISLANLEEEGLNFDINFPIKNLHLSILT